MASDPTVSRLVATLASDVDAAMAALRAARASAREQVWQRRRPVPGRVGGQVVIDLDATLVTRRALKIVSRRPGSPLLLPPSALFVTGDRSPRTAYSEKELAAPTFKPGFGLHPLFAFVDSYPSRRIASAI